jgi:putative aminopeptidase FrvX
VPDASLDLIKKLTNASGAPGFEDQVTEICRKEVADFAEAQEDCLRNLYLKPQKNQGNQPVVMLEGHSDEVGFMVHSINEKGMIKFAALGGWFSQALLGHKVRIRNNQGDYIPAVIASIPPHFLSEGKKNQVIQAEDMFMDVGASSRDQVIMEFGIEPGAPVVPDVDFYYDADNKVMTAKAFDNRLGCAAVVEALTKAKDLDLKVDLIGVLSAQEEVGLRGARISANRVRPQAAIVFEGTPADDTFSPVDQAQAVMKKGPQIRHVDSSMIANPRFVAFAREVARKNSLPFQDAVRLKGGTDAASIGLSHLGVPTIVIGVPVRYAHTHHCMASFEDYQNAVKWGLAIIKELDQETIEGF